MELLVQILLVIFEFFFEVVLECATEGFFSWLFQLLKGAFTDEGFTSPLEAFGYFVLGAILGRLSFMVVPHPIFTRTGFHGISILISPLLTAVLMSSLGALQRQRGRPAMRMTNFGYSFSFAFGMALVRFVYTYPQALT
jgi:hypothetical protein